MADNNFKDYNLDNFEDKPTGGKHFKPEIDAVDNNYNDNFDYDLDNFKSEPVVNKINKQEKPQPDYGDDFYSNSDSFEPNDDDDFQPVITRKSYSRTANIPDKNKKKNVTIIVLSLTLAFVIFVFSLIFFLGSKNDDKKTKPTKAPTVASETVKETRATEKITEAETEAPTEAPTDAPTEAPTESYEEPTYDDSEYIEEETTADDSGYVEEPTYEIIS